MERIAPNMPTLVFSAFFLTFVILGSAQADWIRLGSWNIEHLGRGDEATAPKALAELIFLSGVDILAMQEIYDNDQDKSKRTNIQITGALKELNKIAGQDWTYKMLPNRSNKDTSQLVAVAWNKKRVVKKGEAFQIPIQRDAKEWDRHPHALKFSAGEGKTDIVIIPVHMKADYRGNFASQRGLEARKLVAALDSVRQHFSDKDLIILGDLNCDDRSEPALAAFAAAAFVDLNEHDTATHPRWGPLDRILVARGQAEFRFCKQYIFTAADHETFDRYLSDHQLIATPIRIMADDD